MPEGHIRDRVAGAGWEKNGLLRNAKFGNPPSNLLCRQLELYISLIGSNERHCIRWLDAKLPLDESYGSFSLSDFRA